MQRGLFLLFGFLVASLVTAQSSPAVTKSRLIEVVAVSGGTFDYGDWGNSRKGKITLDGFWMSKTEVTQATYARVMGSNPSVFFDLEDSAQRPVENVSWLDAVDFCNKLSALDGLEPVYTVSGNDAKASPQANGWRLPTDMEWEYAALGGANGKGYRYAGGNVAEDVGWTIRNAGNTTHPVASRIPNELNVFDLTGNVAEWCGSSSIATYLSAPTRGGSFALSGITGLAVKETTDYPVKSHSAYIGFRVVRR